MRWLITFLQRFHNVLLTLLPMLSRFQCLPSVITSTLIVYDGTGNLSMLLLMEIYCLCDELWGIHHTADFPPSFFTLPLLVSAQTVAALDV